MLSPENFSGVSMWLRHHRDGHLLDDRSFAACRDVIHTSHFVPDDGCNDSGRCKQNILIRHELVVHRRTDNRRCSGIDKLTPSNLTARSHTGRCKPTLVRRTVGLLCVLFEQHEDRFGDMWYRVVLLISNIIFWPLTFSKYVMCCNRL